MLSIFVSSLGLLFSVQFIINFYFLVHVNQSLSCIRSCRTDLVRIVFPVIFARFLSHLLYFKLSSLEGFRSAFINSVFSFFCCNCSSESRSKSQIQTVRECFLQAVCCLLISINKLSELFRPAVKQQHNKGELQTVFVISFFIFLIGQLTMQF